MGSAAEYTEPTTGTEKHHQPFQLQEEEEVLELERKKPHGKVPDSTDISTVTSSSSSSSQDVTEGVSDLQIGQGEHITIETSEVPEIDLHENGNNCIVYLDGQQGIWKCRQCDWTYKEGSLLCFDTKGTESAGAHDSPTVDLLNEEKKDLPSDNTFTSEDNKEIEEVQDGDFSKHLATGDVIEEELDAEDYDVEKVLDNQETHDLFCPNCNSCITKRVVLRRKKRKFRYVRKNPKPVKRPQPSDLPHSADSFSSVDAGEEESFVFKCLSCFSIFIPSRGVQGLKTQPKPQEEATAHPNWFSSIFGFKKKESALHQDANPPRDILNVSGEDMTSSAASIPADSPATTVQVSSSHDTSKVVINGVTVEDGTKFVIPLPEEETQQKIDKNDTSAADENHANKGRLSPIQPSHDMNITNTVTSGPDGVKVETVFHSEGVPHPSEGADTSDTRKPDFGPTKVTGVMDTSDTGVTTGPPNPGIDVLPVSWLGEGTLTEPLLRPVVEGRTLEVLKSIVYGGLIESITSLGVISSAAGSGATMLNILVLGIANLVGGLIILIHNLQELREEVPRITTTENDQANVQEEGRYKRLLGRRENFTLHATVAVLSFIVVGLLPPVVYYFSFSKTHNRDYKVASVFGSSLACIVLLAIAKARVKTPRGSYLKNILGYAMIAVSVSGISYVVGNFLDQLLQKYGWSDESETPAGEMMLSLMGRRAGNFGHSSSY